MKKIILTLAGFCFLVAESFSQEIEWQNTIGGSDDDQLYSIQQTSDGGYILGGFSISDISGDKTENNIGGYDYWIVKTDTSGNIQWQNTIGGNLEDNLYSIQQTSDGGYILAGWSNSGISGDKTENSNGDDDYWIVKTDASGNIQWQNTIGGNLHDQLYAIQQTADGGYILGGTSESTISGDKTEDSIGGFDYWIVKTDAAGDIQWQNTIGGSALDVPYSIQQTADGGYIMGGRSGSDISGDKTENSNGLEDYWIVKTDASGNIQWQNTIGGSSYDRLSSVQQTPGGGYILGGFSSSNISGDKTENSNGSEDYWVLKTDASGNIQWQNTMGGGSSDRLLTMQQTADGGYILGGVSDSDISGDKTEDNVNQDLWIIKTDSSGNIQWQNNIGGNGGEYIYSIQETTNEEYILAGPSFSDISGDKTENCIGLNDYWIIKLTDNYNLITGKLFIDANSNNVQDAGEFSLQNKMITEQSTGRIAFTEQSGNYGVAVLDSGNYSVQANSTINYYTSVPATNSAYFSGTQQIDSLNDFAFQPAGVFNDLCVTITPMGSFRANMNANYMINYENVGTTTLNGTVIFFPDNDVTFVSSNVTPTSVATDSVVWDVGTLTPFQTGSILVTVNVNLGTPIGTLIHSSVRIEPVAGDANTACNYNAYEVFVTGSYDPNAILVDRDTVLTTELSSPPYLNYIIYFQNTGNDTAFTVKVVNPIDTFKSDIHSFEFVASSNPVNINYKIWERNMEFTFDNILLPDSNVNEPASHGFIRYRIKLLSTLVAGDLINNTAFIYFDFNAPVQTNTVVTEIVLPTGMGEAASGSGSKQLIVYPNPANDKLIIDSYLLAGKKAEMKIYDLYGREVFQLQTASCKLQTQINVSHFSQGIYFVEMQSGEQVLRGKFLKE